MNRGDVWQLDFGGRAGRRPALIITRQGVISHLNKLTVAEIMSSAKGYPTEVAIGHKANLPKESYVQLDNIQTVSKARFREVSWSPRRGYHADGWAKVGAGARTRRLRLSG